MKKTLFKKYMAMTSLIILVSFCILGFVMIIVVNGNWKQEKRAALAQNARSIAELVGYKGGASGSSAQAQEDLRRFLDINSSNNACDIFVTDGQGQVLLLVQGVKGALHQQDVPMEAVRRAAAGQYDEQTMLGGIYETPCYVVGVPLKLQSGEVAGAVFASISAHSLEEYRGSVLKIFLFAAVAAFLVAFCMVWIFSYNLVRPLRGMASAARSFGEGNFSTRVPVASRDEIGELALALNNMADSLSYSESTRRSFIANVSHELKTPMTTIAGFIDGILDGTIPVDKQQHYLRIVSVEVKRLSRLVHTMLDLSRIENGELALRPSSFDLRDTVINTFLNFEQRLTDNRITVRGLEDSSPILVQGDPDMLHQVVYNLVENATKFTNPGGWVQVRFCEDPQRVQLGIRNSGEGIAPEDLSRIFDRFYKTDRSRSKDRSGLGLGLYIVRTIIKLHGGDIVASSVQGQYSDFTFWLPRRAATGGRKDMLKSGKNIKEQRAKNAPAKKEEGST